MRCNDGRMTIILVNVYQDDCTPCRPCDTRPRSWTESLHFVRLEDHMILDCELVYCDPGRQNCSDIACQQKTRNDTCMRRCKTYWEFMSFKYWRVENRLLSSSGRDPKVSSANLISITTRVIMSQCQTVYSSLLVIAALCKVCVTQSTSHFNMK